MPEYNYPGVYIEEIDSNVHPIEGVSTTTTALVGFTASGPLTPVAVRVLPNTSRTSGCQLLGSIYRTRCVAFSKMVGRDATSFVCRLKPRLLPAAWMTKPMLRWLSKHSCHSTALQIFRWSAALTSIRFRGMTTALVKHCECYRDRVAILSAALGEDYSNVPPAYAQSPFAAFYVPWVIVPGSRWPVPR